MKPDKLPLTLPIGTPVILIDPLNDFTKPEGVFTEAYGAEDTKPVRDVVPVLNAMARAWAQKTEIILCRSLYTYDQFGVKGLEDLCTKENDWGRESVINYEWILRGFDKTENSILATDDKKIFDILESSRFLILAGMTLTSSIAKSKEELREILPELTLVVPRNAAAVRASRKADGEALFQQWADPAEEGVIVTPAWNNIKFKKD